MRMPVNGVLFVCESGGGSGGGENYMSCSKNNY